MSNRVNGKQFEAWNGYEGHHWANNYERYDAANAAANSLLLEASNLQPDSKILDIGCGSGQISRLAARLVRHGQVTGIDLSIPMLEKARELTEREKLTRVEYIHGDVQTHQFASATFDVAISRFGVMFFSDPVEAFRNVFNALRPGGNLAFVSLRNLGPQSELMKPFFAIAELTAVGNSETDADDHENGPGSFSDSERIRNVLLEAGFSNLTMREMLIPMRFGDDASDAAEFLVNWGPSHHMLQQAGLSATDDVINHVASVLSPFESENEVVLSGDIWLVTATR